MTYDEHEHPPVAVYKLITRLSNSPRTANLRGVTTARAAFKFTVHF